MSNHDRAPSSSLSLFSSRTRSLRMHPDTAAESVTDMERLWPACRAAGRPAGQC